MNEELPKIYEQLSEIFRDIFDDDSIVATEDLTAAQVDGWDSLANVRVILAIEGEFDIRYGAGEISSIENVGQIAESIAFKRKQ